MIVLQIFVYFLRWGARTHPAAHPATARRRPVFSLGTVTQPWGPRTSVSWHRRGPCSEECPKSSSCRLRERSRDELSRRDAVDGGTLQQAEGLAVEGDLARLSDRKLGRVRLHHHHAV